MIRNESGSAGAIAEWCFYKSLLNLGFAPGEEVPNCRRNCVIKSNQFEEKLKIDFVIVIRSWRGLRGIVLVQLSLSNKYERKSWHGNLTKIFSTDWD